MSVSAVLPDVIGTCGNSYLCILGYYQYIAMEESKSFTHEFPIFRAKYCYRGAEMTVFQHAGIKEFTI